MALRNQADLWREPPAEAGEDAIVQAAHVTSADAERDLAAAGFDVAQERTKAAAYLRKLDSSDAPAGDAADTASNEEAWVARTPATPIRARATSARWVWLIALEPQ